jgi:hypothetical protein
MISGWKPWTLFFLVRLKGLDPFESLQPFEAPSESSLSCIVERRWISLILQLAADSAVPDPFLRRETQQPLRQILGSGISDRLWRQRGVSSRPCRGSSRPPTRC